MQFGLMFFASSENTVVEDKYRLVIESAKFADQHGFSSVWVPERHFTQMGFLYPNPAVLHAALARETRRIRLQAGSVVVPLHHPIRIAEEWAVVDNLSGGRVGISFASGWHPNDFAFFPEKYDQRRQEMYAGIETVRKLWRGEAISVTNGAGQLVDIKVYPPPVQNELPIWVTAAGTPHTFTKAGELGANLLTHILDQSIEQLAQKIDLYRQARARHGHDPATGQVTLMIHTLVGNDVHVVRELARAPFCEFLKASPEMLAGLARSRGREVDVSMLSPQEIDDFVNFLYDRFASSRGLIGTPETCIELIRQLDQVGVDEVACLLDFGPDAAVIQAHLPYLSQTQEQYHTSAVATAPRPGPRPPQPEVEVSGLQRRDASEWLQDALPQIRLRCDEEIPVTEFYNQLRAYGIQLDTGFQCIERLWRGPGEALGQMQLVDVAPSSDAYAMPPALLDACFQVFMVALSPDSFSSASAMYLPVGLQRLQIHQRIGQRLWSHTVLRSEASETADTFDGDMRLLDEDGNVVVEITGLRVQRTEAVGPQPGWWDWLYALQWEPKPLAEFEPFDHPGRWLILTDRSGIGQHLATLLKEHGEHCVLVRPGDAYELDAEGRLCLNPGCPEEMRQLVQETLGQDPPACRGVVHLWSLDASLAAETSTASLAKDQIRGVASALHLLQALSTSTVSPPVWFVTRGAQSVGSEVASLAVTQAPLWGLGRTVAVESPHLWGGLVDVAYEASADEAARQLLHTIRSSDREDQIAWRQGQRYVARLNRHPGEHIRPLRFRSDATYMIIGGLGGLGLFMAQWMVERGARHLVLIGRRGASESSRETLHQLEQLGAHVLVAQADVAQEAQVAEVLARIDDALPPLRGIFHLAGVLDDDVLEKQTWERFTQVRSAKVEGAWNLHALTQHLPLNYFVLFSSFAVLMNLPGQGNYAAANAFLDALAHYRHAQGQPALSINWGPWAEVGHAATPYGRRAHEYLGRLGIGQMAPAQGFEALDLLLQQEQAQTAVASIDWPRLLQAEITAPSPLLVELMREVRSHQAASVQRQRILQQLQNAQEADIHDLVATYMQEQTTEILRLSASQLDAQQPLHDMGLDSLMAVELKNQIKTDLGVDIALVTVLEGPSVATLVTQVVEQLAESLPAASGVLTMQADEMSHDASLDNSEIEWVEGEL